jgi:hypothetical protein
MNQWTRMALLSAATAGFGGPGLGGCVSGNIPARQQPGSDGSTSNDGNALDDGGTSAADGSGGTEGSTISVADGSEDVRTIGAEASPEASPTIRDAGSGLGNDARMSAADSSVDGATDSSTGGTTNDGSAGTVDGAIVGCISALSSWYVARPNGGLLSEGPPEQAILDSTTGLPLLGAVSMSEGEYTDCAAISSGGVQCWERNVNYNDGQLGNGMGQLGNGTMNPNTAFLRSSVVLAAANTPLTKVTSMVQGFANAACALTSDAKLWCWGDLTWIVNNGTALSSPYAQAITIDGMTPLTGVTQAAVGLGNACAITQGAPNTLWCWGQNRNGELAQGDTVSRQYPTKVLGLTNPVKVAIISASNPSQTAFTSATMCALDGGNVKCWGYAGFGNAGVNSPDSAPLQSPTLVVTQTGAALGGVVDLLGGMSLTTALRNDGTMWWWGYGAKGYAGNYGITNIVAIGWPGTGTFAPGGPRYLTSDGAYHNGMTNVTVNCNAM